MAFRGCVAVLSFVAVFAQPWSPRAVAERADEEPRNYRANRLVGSALAGPVASVAGAVAFFIPVAPLLESCGASSVASGMPIDGVGRRCERLELGVAGTAAFGAGLGAAVGVYAASRGQDPTRQGSFAATALGGVLGSGAAFGTAYLEPRVAFFAFLAAPTLGATLGYELTAKPAERRAGRPRVLPTAQVFGGPGSGAGLSLGIQGDF